jgi:hypothetical protein
LATAVPLDQQRLKSLRGIKGLKQSELRGLTQFQVTECERKGTDSILLLEKFALALDCTPDFLLGRGFETFDFKNPDDVKVVASRLAFDAFAERPNTPDHQRERCRRVVGHRSAPLTADGWIILAEQIDLAFGPTDGGATLRSIEGGKAG